MADLSFEIGALHEIVVQLEPATAARRWTADGTATLHPASQPAWWSVSARWLGSNYCLWFALPLSLYLSSGWTGLLCYGQAVCGSCSRTQPATGAADSRGTAHGAVAHGTTEGAAQ